MSETYVEMKTVSSQLYLMGVQVRAVPLNMWKGDFAEGSQRSLADVLLDINAKLKYAWK